MQFESVKHIAQYYKAIPGMLRLLQQEREELEQALPRFFDRPVPAVPYLLEHW